MSRSVEERAVALLAQMTLDEKIGQMVMYVGESAHDNVDNVDEMTSYRLGVEDKAELIRAGRAGAFLKVPGAREAEHLQALAATSRLRIPLLIATDAVHGHGMDVAAATIFPTPIGLSATFDAELVERVARCTAREMRATGFHWTFSPNVDVVRDPRWGRTGETFGEEPFLVSALGAAMIRGYQGETPSCETVLACAKHLVAGGSPENGLNGAPTEVSERTLREVYYPPFAHAVAAGVGTVMPAHHELNGIPCHADAQLLTGLLRGAWGFEGFVVSDWNDIARLHSVHRVAESEREACRIAVNAGIDMHMHGGSFFDDVKTLVLEQKISESRIDEAVLRILRAKFALGLFEQPGAVGASTQDPVLAPEHRALALEASRQSLVLLKNEGALLPLGKQRSVLVTGPNADNQSILGDWSRRQPAANVVTILGGIVALAQPGVAVEYAPTGGITRISDEDILGAARAARHVDVVVLVVGENSLRDDPERTSGENVDRAALGLPGRQLELFRALLATGTPVVVVLVNGSPICCEWLSEHARAIIEAWEPGMLGGTAVAELLFGAYNPSGRLPITFPRSAGHLKTYAAQRPSSFHRGKFKFTTHEPLFQFGHGLSYTTFAYRALRAKASLFSAEALTVEVDLENTGTRAGVETVLLFIQDLYASVTRPAQELKAVRRVFLEPGERQTVSFVLPAEALSLLNAELKPVTEPGEFRISVGLGAISTNFCLLASAIQAGIHG